MKVQDILSVEEDQETGGTVLKQVEHLDRTMKALRQLVACVQFDFESSKAPPTEVRENMISLRGKEGASDYVEVVFTRSKEGATELANEAPWSTADVGNMHLSHSIDILCPATLKVDGLDKGKGTGGDGHDGVGVVDAANALISCLRTDRPDGLFTTVVCDATGVALGLVYSNAESIRASLSCGRGVYWSRSRGGLWRKGDTSGAWQASGSKH
ncbi:unnamed protein product [Choristocarpus tenellus]